MEGRKEELTIKANWIGDAIPRDCCPYPLKSMLGKATPAIPFVSSSFSFQILLTGRFKEESFVTMRSLPNDERPEEKPSS
jgi:hypothetical protein